MLSIFIPGVGQFYNGGFWRGVFWLILTPGLWIKPSNPHETLEGHCKNLCTECENVETYDELKHSKDAHLVGQPRRGSRGRQATRRGVGLLEEHAGRIGRAVAAHATRA